MAVRDEDEILDAEFEKVVDVSSGAGAGNNGIPNGGAVGDMFDVEDLGSETLKDFDFSQLEQEKNGDRERPTIPKELLDLMEADVEGMGSENLKDIDLSQLGQENSNRERPTIPKELLEAMEVDSEEVSDSVSTGKKEQEEDDYLESPKTLMDWSLDSGDPRWKETRIPWCRGMEYIDGKLAFLTEIDGETYGIGMPFDHAVAIIQQTPKEEGKTLDDSADTIIRYIDPDRYEEEEDSQELMELMAKQVQENLGEDLILRKTPKVLTISGDLAQYTDNWEMNLMDEPVPVDDLMDGMETFVKSALREEKKKGDPVDEFDIAEDKEMAEFYAFMRSELGDEEFEKTLTEEMSDEDKEFAKFFDFELDETDFGETLEDETKKVKKEALSFHPDSDGVALKLIALEFGDRSQSFQLVKLLQPFPLVGKKIEESAENGVRFELLTQQEEEILIPKLQATCQEDLQNAGLSFEKDFQPPAKSS